MTDERQYGLVVVEDGNPPPADYTPARKVRVEIGFIFGNMMEAAGLAEQARLLAEQQLNAALGRVTATGEAPAPATTRKRRTRAEIEADEAAAKAAAGGQPAAEPDADPAAIEAEPEIRTNPEDRKDPAQVETPAADPAGMEEWASPPAEVTDADLNAAVQKRNAVLNDPPKIRTLIGTYNPDPTKQFQLREIPQAKRAEFLAKLEALK